jgi:hypothetical protein
MRDGAQDSNPSHRRCLRRVGEHPAPEQNEAVLDSLRPRTPLARALFPVIGGIGFFALLALATWGIAVVMSGNPDTLSERFAPSTFTVGSADTTAKQIVDNGPLVLPGLIGSGNRRSIVLDYDTTTELFAIYMAYPADRTDACTLTAVRGTKTFTDCEGRIIGIESLALPPAGVNNSVNGRNELILDLKPDEPVDESTTTGEPTTTD